MRTVPVLLIQRKMSLTELLICITLASFVDASPCTGYCKHYGTCTLNSDDEPKCTCTIGFIGQTCINSAMKTLENTVKGDSKYDIVTAKGYTEKTIAIITDHLLHTFQLDKSVISMNAILNAIAKELEKDIKKDDDLFPLTEDYAEVLSYVITILQMKGCSVGQTVNCTIDALSFEQILTAAEENLVKITNLMLETDGGLGIKYTIDKRDVLSLTVLKDKGKNLPFEYTTKYGYLKLPFWETFQDTLNNKIVAVNVLAYITSPYNFVNNTNAATSSVVKVIITDKKGDKLELQDLDDPVDMAVDMSQIFSSTHTWQDMEKMSDGKSMGVAFLNTTYQAYTVEFNIKSMLTCNVFGLFGYSGYPTYVKKDIHVRTKGINKVVKTSPVQLPVSFDNQILQITIYNTKYETGKFMDPLVLTLGCEDDVAKRRKRTIGGGNDHQFRFQELKVVQLDGVLWKTSSALTIEKAEGKNARFKSNFFGTFSSDSLFFPPSTIDFESIFLNFFERLQETPQVLATDVVILFVIVIFAIPLRRADRNDSVLWEYLPLIDNRSDEPYRYCLSVFTAVRSSRHLSSTPYFILEGKIASTGNRILSDGERENFRSGSCSNFLMTTKEDLGYLKQLTVWHDNRGKSPDWMLSKIIVIDLKTNDRFVFICGDWLSLKYNEGYTWRVLGPLTMDILTGDIMFKEISRNGFFDDHLWFSLSKRPNYSRFTRVQRLWTLVGLLFLAMVASAMWYNQEPDEEEQLADETNVVRSVKVGPFTLNYKQIYVGFMSSLITVFPSVIIVSIFRNRNLKAENLNKKDESFQTKHIQKQRFRLPWWTSFIAYFLIIACIASGGFFTFLYSLEFGPVKTNDWLLSFLFGTLQGALLLDPVKVLLVASLLGLCCKKSPNRLAESAHVSHVDTTMVISSHLTKGIRYCPCPTLTAERPDVEILRKRCQLDQQLRERSTSALLRFAYCVVLIFICVHSNITESYHQNEQMKSSVNDTFLANTTEDIWTWLLSYYSPAIWSKYHVNQELKSAYEQRFLSDQYSYRMSLTQLRQVRSKTCDVVDEMKPAVKKCTEAYSIRNEENGKFCKGWKLYNDSCFDENEILDSSSFYQSEAELQMLPYAGEYAYYGGGGYRVELGPKLSLVQNSIATLRNISWIDGKTRAVFIDTVSFNANSRLFNHLKIVFEISEYGSIFMKTISVSSNLYPYVYTLDYLILGVQILFGVITIVRIVFLSITIFKAKLSCLTTFMIWITGLDISLCILTIVFFILRIDRTIEAVQKVRNSNGAYVSFEYVELYDMLYRYFFGGVFFFGIMNMLYPLTFNFHFFLLQKSLKRARKDIIASIILITFAVFAFGCYLYLKIGYLVEDFKDLYSSFITLLRMLLAMISYRSTPEMNSVEGKIVTGLFAIALSIIGINIFIGILTSHFADIKAIQEENVKNSDFHFNQDLSEHLWWRMENLIKGILPKATGPSKLLNPDHVNDKIDLMHQHLCLICDDETKYQLVLMCLLYLMEQIQRNMYMSLECKATYTPWGMRYRFCAPCENKTKLIVYLPDVKLSGSPDIECMYVSHGYYNIPHDIQSQIPKSKTRLFELKLPPKTLIKRKVVLEFDSDMCEIEDYVMCTFDKLYTWKRYGLRASGDHLFCTLDMFPTHCFVVSRQGNITTYVNELLRHPDIEIHKISKEGSSVYLKQDERIRISFPPGAVKNDCNIFVTMDIPWNQLCPFLHIFITEETLKAVEISLPIVNRSLLLNSNGNKDTEKLILIRKDDSEWKTLNSVLKVDAAGFTFEINRIPTSVSLAVGVKDVDLLWVEKPFDRRDTKLIKAINMVCRYECVAILWRKFAQKLLIKIPAEFHESETDKLTIKFSVNSEKCCEFRKIITIPISCQEKCLHIFTKWYRMIPSGGLAVYSLTKLLEDCGLRFISGRLKDRL